MCKGLKERFMAEMVDCLQISSKRARYLFYREIDRQDRDYLYALSEVFRSMSENIENHIPGETDPHSVLFRKDSEHGSE